MKAAVFVLGALIMGGIALRNALWNRFKEVDRTTRILEIGVGKSIRRGFWMPLLLGALCIYASAYIRPALMWQILGVFLVALTVLVLAVSFSRLSDKRVPENVPDTESKIVEKRVLGRKLSSIALLLILCAWVWGWYEAGI